LTNIFELVKEWLTQIKEGLATEQSTIHLKSIAGQARDESYPDVRQSALANNAMKNMPLPLQTLLTALADLKQDIVRDKLLQQANYEARVESSVESAVSTALEALRHCSSEKRDAILAGEANHFDAALQSEVEAIVGPSKPNEWTTKLAEALKAESRLLSEHCVDSNRREPLIRAPKVFASCDRAIKAVEDSKSTRLRLEALAQGPLSSLFEHPIKVETNSGQEEVTLGTQQTVVPEKTSTRYTDIKSLLRRTERMRRSILSLQHTLIDQAVNQAEYTIQLVIHKLLLENFQYVPDADMKLADTKIQSEIKFVIQTITTDKSSLDQVLRNIRSACDAIESETSAEQTAHWIILMAKWRLQLMEAYKS